MYLSQNNNNAKSTLEAETWCLSFKLNARFLIGLAITGFFFIFSLMHWPLHCLWILVDMMFSPPQNPAKQRRVQALWRREASLDLANSHFIFGCGAEKRQASGNRAENLVRVHGDPADQTVFVHHQRSDALVRNWNCARESNRKLTFN